MTSWLDFWNGDSLRPYAGPKHLSAHFAAVAGDVRALVPHAGARVVDFGPGPALSAPVVAAACAELVLCEAADRPREALARRFQDYPGIVVEGVAELAARPDGSIDLFVVNSVVQYLMDAELASLLETARRLLAPEGRLVIGDVIPPNASFIADVGALLSTARAGGFLVEALTGLVKTALSPYRGYRQRHGLRRFGEAEMTALLAGAGFLARRHPTNVGGDPSRVTYLAVPT